jgi:hypothetical protein
MVTYGASILHQELSTTNLHVVSVAPAMERRKRNLCPPEGKSHHLRRFTSMDRVHEVAEELWGPMLLARQTKYISTLFKTERISLPMFFI